jgi:hypothetical protein
VALPADGARIRRLEPHRLPGRRLGLAGARRRPRAAGTRCRYAGGRRDDPDTVAPGPRRSILGSTPRSHARRPTGRGAAPAGRCSARWTSDRATPPC